MEKTVKKQQKSKKGKVSENRKKAVYLSENSEIK